MLLSAVNTGCSKWSKTAKGGVIGAGSGAAIGGVIGSRSGNTAAGAVIGGAVGGVAGAAIGRYMDKQSKKLEEDLGNNGTVERVGDGIRVTLESGVLFAINSSDLTAESRRTIERFAETLKEYPDTNILIEGHTDNTGSADHNQRLSERRAASVMTYMRQQGVAASRMTAVGHGLRRPVADNSTEAGRRQNRRVEFAITANEKLVQDAEAGRLN